MLPLSKGLSVIAVLTLGAVAMAGCQSASTVQSTSGGGTRGSSQATIADQKKASGEVTYTATLSSPVCGSEVVLIGYMTQIQLESNPSTGYSWRLAKPASLFDVAKDDYKPAPKEPAVVGSGGTQIITLRAKQQGEETLNFEYVRAWEKDTAPAKTQQCKVKVVALS